MIWDHVESLPVLKNSGVLISLVISYSFLVFFYFFSLSVVHALHAYTFFYLDQFTALSISNPYKWLQLWLPFGTLLISPQGWNITHTEGKCFDVLEEWRVMEHKWMWRNIWQPKTADNEQTYSPQLLHEGLKRGLCPRAYSGNNLWGKCARQVLPWCCRLAPWVCEHFQLLCSVSGAEPGKTWEPPQSQPEAGPPWRSVFREKESER